LNKKDQYDADLVYRQEQNIIKKEVNRKNRTKRKDRGATGRKRNKTGPFAVAPSGEINIAIAAPTSRTDASLNLGLHYLDVNGTAPSISTGLAGMGLAPVTHNRKRNRPQLSAKRKFSTMDEGEDSEALDTVKAEPLTFTPPPAYVDSSAGTLIASPAQLAPPFAFSYSIENAPKKAPGSCNTYHSDVPHPKTGKTYVDTAIQTDAAHICIGDCQCPI
jgi:hypothetical protein